MKTSWESRHCSRYQEDLKRKIADKKRLTLEEANRIFDLKQWGRFAMETRRAS